MTLFGFACPLCILLFIGFLLFLNYFSITAEKFTSAEIYHQSKCTSLNFNNCLQTSGCGWLINGNNYSQCLPGTPVGPINPKLQPDAEESQRRNVQHDRWIYSHPNPFIFC